MYKGQISLIILSTAGYWRPIGFSFFAVAFLYNIYSIFMTFLVYSFDMSLYMYLILHAINDIDDFSESLCWFLLSLVVCVKLTNLLIKRNEIIDLINMMDIHYFSPRDHEEEAIQQNYDYMSRRNTMLFLIGSLFTMTALTLGGLARSDIILPFKTTLPFDNDDKIIFWLTYVVQTLSIYSSGLTNVGVETLVMVIMLQICCQLEIIYHRLEEMTQLNLNDESSLNFSKTKEARILVECVRHHDYVYLFSERLNDIFSIVFGMQFIGSITNICTLIYSLSTKTTVNDKVLAQGLLLPNILFQTFIYCLFGNEVMLKSLKVADVISMMDWTMLRRQSKKGLLMIAMRARNPIIITGGSLIPMSLNTFVTPKNLYESKIVNKYFHIGSLESSGIFFATYLYQSVAIIMSALITSSVECFALMVILIICGQFEIFVYRLNLLATIKRNNKLKSSVHECEEKLIKNFVRHHNCMYSLGVNMNNIFGTMIFVQFFSSLIQLCTTIFQSRMHFKNHDLWSRFSLLCTSFLQLYLYSFSGEKIMEKSSLIAGEIYQTKWNKLTSRSRKNLILIMIRALRPIKLMGSSIVVMSLDTFVKVVKLSFSTYNLLIKL
ncbi:odorant receptor 46a-like [Leptopilina heterotoma]|uniref:odorant receptor 46a-like n=1 Tax=Leptopilina heterotoma TaxID=63436 RepID=UPI001CA9B8AC|nr:odorant receptor 46a-like [Leptopilina heterotoma]